MTLYHGSSVDFERFDPAKIKYVGCNGDGFYFTPDLHMAKTYGDIVKAYEVVISHPLKPNTKKLTLPNYEDLITHIWKNTDCRNDLKNYGWFNDSDFNSFMKAKALELFNRGDDYGALFDLTHSVTGSMRTLFSMLEKSTGQLFNGVISEGFHEWVAFHPSQIKVINKV